MSDYIAGQILLPNLIQLFYTERLISRFQGRWRDSDRNSNSIKLFISADEFLDSAEYREDYSFDEDEEYDFD